MYIPKILMMCISLNVNPQHFVQSACNTKHWTQCWIAWFNTFCSFVCIIMLASNRQKTWYYSTTSLSFHSTLFQAIQAALLCNVWGGELATVSQGPGAMSCQWLSMHSLSRALPHTGCSARVLFQDKDWSEGRHHYFQWQKTVFFLWSFLSQTEFVFREQRGEDSSLAEDLN